MARSTDSKSSGEWLVASGAEEQWRVMSDEVGSVPRSSRPCQIMARMAMAHPPRVTHSPASVIDSAK